MKELEKKQDDLQASLAALSEREEKFRQLFDADLDAVIVFDSDSQVIEEVNRAAVTLFGFSKAEFSGLPLERICLTQKQSASDIIEMIRRYDRAKKILHAGFVRKDMTEFPGAFYGGVFKVADKEKMFVGVRDITEKLQTEELLLKSQEQLVQAQKMEALGALVAGVAHEINNPINLIMYNIPLIQRIWNDFKPVMEAEATRKPDARYGGLTYSFITENLDQMIADMDLAAKRVETIVRRLKDFARKSSILEKTEISVNDAIQNALRLARSTLRKSRVTIRTELADNLPLINGHLQSIEQVMLNLVINAIEAIDHEHGEIMITSGVDKKDKNLIVTVQDNGCGMTPETRAKIFDPFFTEKQTRGGTGLGLSVSYSLIKSHEGDILCRSRPGKGSIFEIRLPLEPEKRMTKVLIADDDPALRKLLTSALTRSGDFTVETAANGTEALIRLGTWMPDLLILDLFMPQMNGLEVCRTITREQKLSNLKVVVITGIPESPEIEEIKKLGVRNVFEKPLQIKKFIRAISGLF